jgi:F-box and WD-40 domain protein 1/11
MAPPIPFDSASPDAMEPFPPTQEPDEGYSEHPLYPSSVDSTNALAPAASQLRADNDEFITWLLPRLSTLTVQQKTQMAMHILNELRTNVLAEIVEKYINPRLFIDFVDYLPTEICLKIFEYLDPVSLINVARSCRGWYNLALDRKLWEQVFYLEGWQALPREIEAAERRMNTHPLFTEAMHPQRLLSSEFGHAHKKRAISDPPPRDIEHDAMDIDRDDGDADMSGTSLFGGPQAGSGSSTQSTGSVVHHLGHLMMQSPSPMPETSSRVDVKGKGRATTESMESQTPSIVLPGLPKSSLWAFDAKDNKHKINWQYLYTMRRRLEYNWEAGKFTNFQLPHPDFPQEGHKECVYSLQFNSDYLVSGSRDKSLRIWNLRTRRLVRQPLWGHAGSVLCLQFDSDPEEDIIVSGSSDSDVIIWKFSTGEKLQVLKKAHTESVLNVKFDKRILVTCSKDRTIKIFNRRPLRAGDQGYGDVNMVGPVPTNVRDYNDSPWSLLPIKPPFTQIGCLEGHGAAVNAVQICGTEIVSASGDRHIKVWDWPHQICRRTFLGHHKGIACVQYDGRRIISGSSDNEVKVFDRETGLEVATLRAHSSLVRTVQAGFGDLPYSVDEDRITAKAVDNEFFAAVKAGTLGTSHNARGKVPNAGSRRPEDITNYGAKLPPGGGGGPYGRIVSGSYDQTIIIWRRDKEGKWRNVHTLRHEEAAAAAVRQESSSGVANAAARVPSPTPTGGSVGSSVFPSLHHNARPLARHPPPPAPPASAPPMMQSPPSITHVEHPIHATVTPQTTISYTRMIDNCVPQGPAALQNALTSFPTMLAYHGHLQAAMDREPNGMTRSQLKQVVASALQRAQIAQNRAMGTSSSAPEPSTSQSNLAAVQASGSQAAIHQAAYRHIVQQRQASSSSQSPLRTTSQAAGAANNTATATSSVSAGPPVVTSMTSQHAQSIHQSPQTQALPPPQTPAQTMAAATPAAPAPVPIHHPHIQQVDAQAPRVFKLQFDAHRIICCSQAPIILGWDFCNGDPELDEAVRYFAPVE